MESTNPTIVVTPSSSTTSLSGVEKTELFSKNLHDAEHDLKHDFVEVETMIEDIRVTPSEKLAELQHEKAALHEACQRVENLQKFASDVRQKLSDALISLEHVDLRDKRGRAWDSGISLASSKESRNLSETNFSPVTSPTDSIAQYQSTVTSNPVEHDDKVSLSVSLSDSVVESDNEVTPDIGAKSDTGPVTFT